MIGVSEKKTNKPLKQPREIERFLKLLVDSGGSDLHIKSGSTPRVRIHGSISNLSREILSPQAVNRIIENILSEEEKVIFERDKEIDLILEVRQSGRFRINIYKQMMGLAIAARHIKMTIPSFEDLNLPKVLYGLTQKPRGLILITGATGSGKSTTMAAMVDVMNRERSLNIITIEDPIEFAFKERKSTIQQREIGRDTPTWSEALRRIVRQDPDVIMLGEIKDSATMLSALNIANTGHLVLSTMHTTDASQTINRIISLVPDNLVEEVRHLLASTLMGIVSQRLLPRSDGTGRIPAVEILVTTETLRKLIITPEQDKGFKQIISEGQSRFGMQTFDQSLMQLVNDGGITMDEALKYASSPTDFRIKARGINEQSGMDWHGFDPDVQSKKK